MLSFSLDSRWGLHADRLALGKGQTYARSVPGLALLQAADRTLTSCHLTSDLLVADLAVTQGRHYWACSVEPGSYLVKVRRSQSLYRKLDDQNSKQYSCVSVDWIFATLFPIRQIKGHLDGFRSEIDSNCIMTSCHNSSHTTACEWLSTTMPAQVLKGRFCLTCVVWVSSVQDLNWCQLL